MLLPPWSLLIRSSEWCMIVLDVPINVNRHFASLRLLTSLLLMPNSLFLSREFIVKCHGCRNVIEKSALVMTAKNFYYHVNCFVCANCSDTLVTGDQFSVSAGGNLYCHSDACIQELTASSDDGWSDGNSSVSCGTYKETGTVHTIFSLPSFFLSLICSIINVRIKIVSTSENFEGIIRYNYYCISLNKEGVSTQVRTAIPKISLLPLVLLFLQN